MDALRITLHRNGVPFYLQLCDQLEEAIESGSLALGARLPAERELARQLTISRTTVTNAYRELEARGLVRGHVGRGTYVCASPDANGASFSWTGKVSLGALRTVDPSLRLLARSASDRSVISFAAAVSAQECFPNDAFREATDRILDRFGPGAVGLGPTEGQFALRKAIADRSGVHPRQVLVVSGAQQGLDLIARCLLDPGDTILIDRPGYLGAIQTFRANGAQLIGWDSVRCDLDRLESLIVRYRPKFLYTNPTFQNPTGQTMPVAQRRALLQLAARYRLPIIEDEPYRELGFEQAPPPSLFQLDEHHVVIYVGTFSKSLAGGLRLGWLMASDAILEQLILIKQRNDVSSPTLEQLVVSELLRSGEFDRHLERLRAEHRRRCQAMVAALEEYVEPGALEYRPVTGGMYLWCTYKSEIEARDLLQAAQALGVVFIQGNAFYPDDGGRHQLRLCFSSVPGKSIEEGIGRIAPLFSVSRPPLLSSRSMRDLPN